MMYWIHCLTICLAIGMLNYQTNSFLFLLESIKWYIQLTWFCIFLVEIFLIIFSVVWCTYLEHIRRPEAANPEEAALCGGRPHPCDEVEDICPGRGVLEAEQLIVVGQGVVNDRPEVTVRQVSVQASPELNHAPAVVVQPSAVLGIEHSSIWKQMPQLRISAMPNPN